MEEIKAKKDIPIFISLIPIITTGLFLFITIHYYQAEPHVALFIGNISIVSVALLYGYTWEELEKSIVASISEAITAIVILLIIGMLIGTWTANGVVPALMYYGFNIFNEHWFLPSILVLCSVISVLTGSSWTTAGTVGIAAIGIGRGIGIPEHIIAGTVVSGAFFGDKLSPLSDSTNLTPSLLNVDIYDHIKHMVKTTIPSFVIALVAYAVIGFLIRDGGNEGVDVLRYQEAIRESFNFSILLVLPPLGVIIMIFLRVPAIPSLTIGVALGAIVQFFAQGDGFGEVVRTIYSGAEVYTGWSEMDDLLSGGGMSSMYTVVALAIIALPLGGMMNDTGILKTLVSKLNRVLKTQGSLIFTTVFTAVFINIFGANQYLAVILPGQMYEEKFEDINLDKINMTRALEAGGTLTAPLIPWNSSGVFMLSVLGVSPTRYLPYAIICWLTLFIVIVFGYKDIYMKKS